MGNGYFAAKFDKKCPKCGISYKKGSLVYYGTWTHYPKCPDSTNSVLPEEKEVKAWTRNWEYSQEQKEIISFVFNSKGNLIISAGAGCGKSTTLAAMLYDFPAYSLGKIIYLAFNKKNVTEMESNHTALKNLHDITFSTTHSLGYSILKFHFGYVKVDGKKDFWRITDIIPLSEDAEKEERKVVYALRKLTAQLVSLAKNNALNPNNSTFEQDCADLIELHKVQSNDATNEIIQYAKQVLLRTLQNFKKEGISFDDMLFIPAVLLLESEVKYNRVLVDEAQDQNKAQSILLSLILAIGGKIVFVGDKFQGIYMFRGAMLNALEILKEKFNCESLPLMTTRRCGKKIVEFANQFMPDLRAGENNHEGEVSFFPSSEFIYDKVENGDAILCRTNAPLVKVCLRLIRMGKNAKVLGREIAENLIALAIELSEKSATVDDFLYYLQEWGDKEFEKIEKKNQGKEAKMLLEDKIEILKAIADDCEKPNQIESKLSFIFSDDNEGIILCSIHKAKGLEWERVFVIRWDLLPHPKATSPIELEQENNMAGVAVTRAKKYLGICEKE